MRRIPIKGRAVFATRSFERNEFVVEYVGKLTDVSSILKSEVDARHSDTAGASMCYYYIFKCRDKTYW